MTRRSARSKKADAAVAAAIGLTSAGSSATSVNGKYRPTRSTLGTIKPMTGAGPQAPAAQTKRQAGLVRYTSSQRSPRAARLAARHSRQPGVPRVDERVRRAAAQEIAVARQLAEQSYFQ